RCSWVISVGGASGASDRTNRRVYMPTNGQRHSSTAHAAAWGVFHSRAHVSSSRSDAIGRGNSGAAPSNPPDGKFTNVIPDERILFGSFDGPLRFRAPPEAMTNHS